MKITEKLNAKNKNIYEEKPVTVAFLGDSVTQGCYECYINENGSVCTVFDRKSAYSARFAEFLSVIYPEAQVNIINSGLSGDGADGGLNRFDRDVAPYSPDLVVLGFALNDSCSGLEKLNDYKNRMAELIKKSAALGAEVIVLTPNMFNTNVSCHLSEETLKELAETFMKNQGILDEYVKALKEAARENGAKVCDVHKYWKLMDRAGVNITELLANKLNHPIRELHNYTAIKLIETILED